jgi:hypothetical protein
VRVIVPARLPSAPVSEPPEALCASFAAIAANVSYVPCRIPCVPM